MGRDLASRAEVLAQNLRGKACPSEGEGKQALLAENSLIAKFQQAKLAGYLASHSSRTA